MRIPVKSETHRAHMYSHDQPDTRSYGSAHSSLSGSAASHMAGTLRLLAAPSLSADSDERAATGPTAAGSASASLGHWMLLQRVPRPLLDHSLAVVGA